MGFEVIVEDERGTKVTSLIDPKNILHRVLPAHDDPGFQCLNQIDWYGNTVFNRYQINMVLQELKRLLEKNKDAEAIELIRQIYDLSIRCKSEPHLYLKFYGD